jgi:hypothetical protein
MPMPPPMLFPIDLGPRGNDTDFPLLGQHWLLFEHNYLKPLDSPPSILLPTTECHTKFQATATTTTTTTNEFK